MNLAMTLGELKASGYRYRSVKDEMRENLIARLRLGEPLFRGIVGYDDTVVPQIVNAILSRHDMLFLGLRGQAKTRMMRGLSALLDEAIPIVDGVDLPDDPIEPRFRQTRESIAERGDATPIRWLSRQDRYHEKLATPDVTIADLIGEIDLVKHAQGRHLSDESIMHFGMIPRSNRGLFGINELPDLAPKIQVGLFNVLEERDVQIRGFPVRLELDVALMFSANPEDYTNRGRIVTPLKDRIGSVIRTHYPRAPRHAMAITRENAWLDRGNGAYRVETPNVMLEIVESIARLARQSPHINQQSGVSVRVSITNAENMVSNAEKRAIVAGETHVVPRVSDLHNLSASCRGKIELMLAEGDEAEDKLVAALVGEAIKDVCSEYIPLDDLDPVVEQFQGTKLSVELGDDVPSSQIVKLVDSMPELKKAAVKLCNACDLKFEEPAHLACAAELVLETLYVNNRLSKYAYRGHVCYKR